MSQSLQLKQKLVSLLGTDSGYEAYGLIGLAGQFTTDGSTGATVASQKGGISDDLSFTAAQYIEPLATATQILSFVGTPAAGSFKLYHNGQTTGTIAFNANAAAVQTALRLLTGMGSVTVTGSYASGFTVVFTSVTGIIDPLVVKDNTLVTSAPAAVTISVADAPGTAVSGAYKISTSGLTWSDVLTLHVTGFLTKAANAASDAVACDISEINVAGQYMVVRVYAKADNALTATANYKIMFSAQFAMNE